MTTPPRVVIDTNILISSLWGGYPGRIIEAWSLGSIIVVVSRPVIHEYVGVLRRFRSDPADLAEFTRLFTPSIRTVVVTPRKTITAIPDDPPDNRFLECAVAGRANFIVSGDSHLLDLKSFAGIPILKAIAFCQLPVISH